MTIQIIIADDHAVVRDGLKLLLESQAEIKVTGEAANGREAIHLANEVVPDVVLMDIGMPELNGIEATRRIHEEHPGIKVVVLSMHSSSEHIFRALEAGAQGYLLKESAGREVSTAVRAVFAGQRYLSEKINNILIDDYLLHRKTGPVVSPLDSLSSREREVLQLSCEGRSTAEIAEKLYLSVKTIETYRSRLMRRLGIRDIPSLVKFAIQNGLISVD